MKKFIIAACMMLIGFSSAFAQQGKQAIGGNLSYGTEIESVGLGVKYQLISDVDQGVFNLGVAYNF